MEIGVAIPNIGPMATKEALFAIAERADELGLDAVWFGDHLAFPRNPKLPYPYSRGTPMYLSSAVPVLDPLAAMAAVVARTRRVRVGTSVLILPYRHPLVTAKLLSTIDVLSNGRVILGVGAGWIPEEFEAAGASFHHRGAVTDEQIRYLREVWSKDQPKFEGRFYTIDGLDLFPKPARRSIPIWIGGQTPAAMRRAAKLGDGLHMIDLTLDELKAHVEQFRRVCAEARRPMSELVLSIRSQLRLTARPETANEGEHPITGNVRQCVETLREFTRLGIQNVCLGPRPEAPGLPGYLRDVETIAKEIAPALR